MQESRQERARRSIAEAHPLASREAMGRGTSVFLRCGLPIGEDHEPAILVDPCPVRCSEDARGIAVTLARLGVSMLELGKGEAGPGPAHAIPGRAGGDRGLDRDLALWSEAAQRAGIGIAAEVEESADLERLQDKVDLIRVPGSRMQDPVLLRRLGRGSTAVLLERGSSATLSELLWAAEYVLDAGNASVVLGLGGIRAVEGAARDLVDLAAVPVLREKTHLPIIVTLGHRIGPRSARASLARAAVAVGADGLSLGSQFGGGLEELLSDLRRLGSLRVTRPGSRTSPDTAPEAAIG